jgi:hypothetical protein
MPDITITCEGIAKLLLNLNPNKAAGPDENCHLVLMMRFLDDHYFLCLI